MIDISEIKFYNESDCLKYFINEILEPELEEDELDIFENIKDRLSDFSDLESDRILDDSIRRIVNEDYYECPEYPLHYLTENDSNLSESIQLAIDMGYSIGDIDANLLANLHYHNKMMIAGMSLNRKIQDELNRYDYESDYIDIDNRDFLDLEVLDKTDKEYVIADNSLDVCFSVDIDTKKIVDARFHDEVMNDSCYIQGILECINDYETLRMYPTEYEENYD